ncbi:hypothetical protein [Reyranella sp. CPCC 100927]|uniref:hypothetical protein n=1 Tax=Reyranella sp. CPCC 100927 TaxID=2599616 RepID=UPI0011B72361|nr:hypothetical protein [Reyranella sp. CPCC 100927]TWT00227.1 hypothetical protein FQU96_33405 [Reyranella sp. CPCC 100927]
MAVGFEFQSPTLKIYRITRKQEIDLCRLQAAEDWVELKRQAEAITAKPSFFSKSVVLSRSAGWYAVPDGDDVEFVVTHVPIAGDGAVHLGTTMTNLEATIDEIETLFTINARRTNCPWVVRSDAPALFGQYPPFLLKWDMPNRTEVIGFPQITGGIALEKLRKVFKILAQNTEASDIFLGVEKAPYVKLLDSISNTFEAKKTPDPKWPDHVPSREMRSLVSLIGAYLHRGASNSGQGLGAVKQLWFIMSRTDFGALFRQLPDDERQRYQQAPRDWVDYICATVMPAINPAAYTPAMNPDGWLIDRLITDYKELQGDQRVQIEITRRDWLTAMTNGTDLLTAAAHPHRWWKRKNLKMYFDVHGEPRLRGSGALGTKMDEVVISDLVTVDAPIFEFRAPGVGANVMPHSAWSAYAIKAYRFLSACNVVDKKTPVDGAGPW